MKKMFLLVLLIGMAAGWAGCASNNNKGGSEEPYVRGYSGDAYYPNSPPTSPALPQSNPQDFRSPNALTSPVPHPLSPPGPPN